MLELIQNWIMLKNYIIEFNPNIDLNIEIQAVAVIRDKKTGWPLLPVVMTNENITRVLPELECGLTMDKTIGKFYVSITKRFYDEYALAKPLFFECSMMHELGHYLHKDLQNGYGNEINQKRHLNDILNNRVTKEEFEADIFALSETSKSMVINDLNYLAQYLRKRPSLPEEALIAQKEIQIRIKAIQKYKG